jgi:hypothetical protein
MTEADWLSCAEPITPYQFLRGETVTYKTRWQGWVTACRFPVSERKLRLFACACCGRVAHLLPVGEARRLLAVSEAYAEGSVRDADVEDAERACVRELRGRAGSARPWLTFEQEAFTAVTRVHRTEAAGRFGSLIHAARAWTGAAVWYRHVASLGGVLRVKPGEFAPLEAVVRTCDRPFLAAEHAAEAARQADLLRDVVGNPFRPVSVDPQWLEWRDGTVGRMARAIYSERRFFDMAVLSDALEDAGCTDVDILSHCRDGGPHVRGCWALDLLIGNK